MIIITLSTASFTPQASWCQPAVWCSLWGFWRRSLPETLVAGWQLPNGDPSDGAGLSAVSAGYDAGPQPDHTHPRLRICQPFCSCCAVSFYFFTQQYMICSAKVGWGQLCTMETDWFITESDNELSLGICITTTFRVWVQDVLKVYRAWKHCEYIAFFITFHTFGW